MAEKMSQKTLLTSGLLDDVVYQDNHLVYDAQHRLRAVFDGRSDVRITYDLAGNRSQVKTHVINTIRTTTEQGGLQERQVVHTDTTDFQYDAMNRQAWSQQVSSVNGGVETHTYEYDLAGNRTLDRTVTNGQTKTYTYTYDDLHRIDYYRGDGASDQMDRIRYDGAGRQVAARTLIGETGGSYEYRYSQYDAAGKLQDVHTVVRSSKTGDNQKVSQTTNVAYHDAGGVTGLGYDAAGNLKGVRQDGDGGATTTTYQYTYLNGSWQQSAALTRRGGDVVGTITQRDANGFVVGIRQPKATGSAAQAPDGSLAAALTNQATQATSNDARYDRTFVNDANGTAVFVSQGGFNEKTEVQSSIANPASGYQGGVTGSSLTPGHVQRQLVANGEVLARYGDAPTQEENTPQTNTPAYVDTADFRLQAAQIRPRHKSLDPVAYTVVGGETLKDIARNVLGDASLWWRIAEANSLAVSGDGALTAGQTLTVPKLSLNANGVETFQPYDPSQAMGSMDPVLPVPANGGGCGGIGAIIMVAVAVVVSIYTAGVLSGASVNIMQAGMSVLSGGTFGAGAAGIAGMSQLGVVGAAMAAGAVGSVASQAVGNLIGSQDGFNWKSVALSALGSGVGSALSLSGALPQLGSPFADAALRQAVSGTISQGIGTVTGLQSHFDWKSVAAGAVGAGVGATVGQALQSGNVFGSLGSEFATGLARGAVSGFAAGMTTAVLKGGRVSVQQVATDAFGNALGQSLAAASGTQVTFAQDTAARSRALDPMGLRQMAPTAASPDGEGAVAYPVRMPGDIETQPLPAQVEDVRRTVRAGEFGGSLERIARSELGTGASQRAINNYVGQLFEINGISNARRIMPDQSIMLPGADTAAATTGLRLYGNDIAIGEQAAAEQAARQAAAAQQAAAQAATLANQDVVSLAGMRDPRMLSRRDAEAMSPANDGSRPVQYLSQWDGVTRQAPIVNYLQSTLGGMDPVRGSQLWTQVAKGLPEAAINEFGGFALAKVLGAGARIFNVARSETSLLNAELNATFSNGLARDLPLSARLDGVVGVGNAGGAFPREPVILDLFGGRTSQIPGAINVDIVAQEGVRASATQLPFRANSADKIVASNPYLPDGSGIMDWLPGAAEALKPGGTLTINATPLNKFGQLPSTEVLESLGLKVVQPPGPLLPDFRGNVFRYTDGGVIPPGKVGSTVLKKIGD
ncbi:LysM peptidoglycan-binding domain-containing protein [Paracidovorax cattleyae]|uniref:LysM peptidoglycan-binding domain-containing protein n=1 Tax=Paracidovorax cattleyae TaxID=80868 RepID=UPI003A92F02B